MKKIWYFNQRKFFYEWVPVLMTIFFIIFSFQPVMAADAPLTLSECLSIAFKKNLDIDQAKKGRKEASFRVKQAHARNYPEVGINAGAGYISEMNQIEFGDMSVKAPGLPPMTIPARHIETGDHENADLSVALTQPVYTGGMIEGGIKAAQANMDGWAYQVALAKSEIRIQIITAFYQLANAIESKRIALASRDQIESHLKDARNLTQQGMMLKSDLLPIDIRRLDTELMIVKAENAISRGQAALAERMGLSPDTKIEIADARNDSPPWPIPDKFASNIPLRPEQQIIRKQIDAASAEIDIAKGAQLPQIGLEVSGHYGWPGFVATEPQWDTWWQAGMNVSWNIFDMERRKNEEHAAYVKKERLKQAKASIANKIILDQINTRLAYTEAYHKMLINREKVESARENYFTKENNFKVGMASNTDYLDAHTELMNAQSELSMTSAQVQIAWADFLKAMGRDQDKKEITR